MSRKPLYIQSPEGEKLMLCGDCKRYKPCNEEHFSKRKNHGGVYLKDCIACQEARALRKAKRDEYHEQLEGFIYFIYGRPRFARDRRFVKIGWSIHPSKRFTDAYPDDTILLGLVYGQYTDEAGLHSLFNHISAKRVMRDRRHCEWFFADDELLDFIQEVAQHPIRSHFRMMEAKELKQQLREREAS